MKNKRIAVIGLGDISPFHTRTLLAMPDKVTLCAVCDIAPEKQKLHPEIPFYRNYMELLEKEKPDCVHLCLPHYLHAPVIKAAVEHSVHVFTEKPLALNTAQAQELATLQTAHPEVKIGLCFQNRYNMTTQTLKALLADTPDDPVQSVKGLVVWSREKSYYESKPWRGRMATAGGGVMINQAIHTLDLMRYLGGEICSVRGTVSQLLDYGIEVEDTACARLDYASGAVGTFFATVAHGENTGVELSVKTARSTYIIRDDRLYRKDGQEEILLAKNPAMPGAKFYYGTSHETLIRLFYEDLETGACRYPTVADGVASLKLIDAIRQSSNSKTACIL